MKRTFCTVIRDDRAEAVLGPYAAAMARARHWQFREIHIKRRPLLAVRKEAQSRFGLTKRQALANEFDLDQAVESWRGTLDWRVSQVEDRIGATSDHVARLKARATDPTVSLWRRNKAANQAHGKARHLGALRDDLLRLRAERTGPPRVCFGGRELLRGEDVAAWRARRHGRMLLVGSKGEAGGNQTAQYDPATQTLTLRLPDAGMAQARERWGEGLGRHGRIRLEGVRFRYGQAEVARALARGVALTWLLFRDETGRWHSHVTLEEPPAELVTDLRAACLGLDLNVDHVAAVVSDHMGNPVARATFPFPEAGTPEGRARAMVGDAVAGLVALALEWQAGLAAEDLDFARKKAALKVFGKAHARRLSGWAYGRFRDRLGAACARQGVDLHLINPAFTSVIGGIKYARGRAMSRHHAGALVIARRAQGFGERFVCMAHTPLRGPGRNQRRHRWVRWRNARPMAIAEGNGAGLPRRSVVGSGRIGQPPPVPAVARVDKAGPTLRTRCRDAERTETSPPQVGGAVAPAGSG